MHADISQAEEDAFAAALGDDPNDILAVVDEAPPKKSSSKDKDSKKKSDKLSSKLDSKSSKKSAPKEEPVIEPIVEPTIDEFNDLLDPPAPAAEEAAGWGFWGNVDWIKKKTRSILKDEEWKEKVMKRWEEDGSPKE